MFKWLHGKAVQDGELRFVSVSSMQKADASSESGCLRAWYYQYVEGKKEPPSPAMARGTQLHAELANYLTTGTKNLSTQVLSNLHMVPEPGPDLFVEHDIVPIMEDGSSGLLLSPLRASGIPVVGAIDLMHARGTNKGASDVEDIHDPEGTVEVLDWKFVSKMDWAKPGNELINTIQMSGYAKYVYNVTPAKLVRISHGYMPSRGLGRKMTAKVTREQVDESWNHAERIASTMRDAAKETNPDLVDANTRACRAYGRECIHKPYCKAGMHNSLVDLFGTNELVQIGKKTDMDLLAHIKSKKVESTNDAVLAEIGKLAVQEAEAKGTGIAEICAQILAVGLGFPTLTGAAAAAVTAAGFTGSAEGEIAHVIIDDPNKLTLVLDDAKGIIAQRNALADPSAILPPDAPDSGVVEVAVPEVIEVTTPETEALAAIAEPKKKGRPKKAVDTTPTMVVNNVTVQAPVVPAVEAPQPLVVYIDAIPTCEYQSLWPLVLKLTNLMNEKAGGMDFRIQGVANGVFEFGKWKGILATLTREAFNKEIIGGHHVLDGTQGEISQVIAETLREVVALRGGTLVRGSR